MGRILWCGMLVTASLAGCRGILGFEDPVPKMRDSGNGSDVDGSPGLDARFDAPLHVGCWGTAYLSICLNTTPPANLVISTPTNLDTDTSPLCAATTGNGAVDVCTVAADQIHITSTGILAATGSKPLVLIGTSSVVVDGTIDAASHPTTAGPGANAFAYCSVGVDGTADGGSWGGSFGGVGGTGGKSVASGSTGGTGGVAQPNPTVLRGGCRGAPEMNGGGAIDLIAGSDVTITGVVNASGGGGRGSAVANVGGRGGGSGGMIVFDSFYVTVTASAQVFANGGGGGEGAAAAMGSMGGDALSATVAALGGAGTNVNGGDGGTGSVGATLAGGRGLDAMTTGGGGGGGAGIIKLYAPYKTLAGAVSPPPS